LADISQSFSHVALGAAALVGENFGNQRALSVPVSCGASLQELTTFFQLLPGCRSCVACWPQGSLLSLEGMSISYLLASSTSEVTCLQETDHYKASRRGRGIGTSPAPCLLCPSHVRAGLVSRGMQSTSSSGKRT